MQVQAYETQAVHTTLLSQPNSPTWPETALVACAGTSRPKGQLLELTMATQLMQQSSQHPALLRIGHRSVSVTASV